MGVDDSRTRSRYPESEADFDAASAKVLAEVKTWFHSLPQGVAEFTVSGEAGKDMSIEIRPLGADHTPPILILMNWDELEVWVDGEWAEGKGIQGALDLAHTLSPVDALDAIAHGRVARTRYKRKGKVIRDKLEARSSDGTVHVTQRARSLLGFLLPEGVLSHLPGVERHVMHYPPYS